ncbi:lipid kinase, YegS/Rv2252/BmrU family [Streptococcus ictaluri 707-05]|uniref:Lipid kinase, YegS/Rv2252/BmrU family n=1 Tax=Streptococcus ictaluri 707-05 TaxID=764299 RepID=G5JZH3_9STRE|nr:lipid kinase, YegS/Rv2252/BmrU family [Streptococcus ictaluri 707-05]
MTEEEGDAKAFATQAAQEGYHSVFAMGGDGTLNEVVNGLANQDQRPRFGFFPLGTVNDLARALAIPLDPLQAIDEMKLNRTRLLDIGKINDTYFTNIVAIGNIPESINNVDDDQKTLLGPFAYVLSGLKDVLSNESYEFHIVRDNQEEELKSSLLLIGLTNSIGGMKQITNQARVDDGYLHLVYTKDHHLMDMIKSLPSLFADHSQTNDQLGYYRVKKVKVSVAGPVLGSNVDGDEGDELPLEIHVLPHHLQVYTTQS